MDLSKQHISDLALLLKLHGTEQAVIAPGSRNAPLIQAITKELGDGCVSIVDERSAGYFALGLSLQSQKPVAVVCTSGTAVLNLGPALAEAYYQNIPLIAITADRPCEWIGQQDNQAINQHQTFANFTKLSVDLPVESLNEDELWHSNRMVNEALLKAFSPEFGPVHINVPLREPLYNDLPTPSAKCVKIEKVSSRSFSLPVDFIEKWNSAKSIWILAGQSAPNKELNSAIGDLLADPRIELIAESISNTAIETAIKTPEVLVAACKKHLLFNQPDVVLYFGGQLVSKRLKNLLRQFKSTEFWLASPSNKIIDTFQSIKGIIQGETTQILEAIANSNLAGKEGNQTLKQIEESIHVKANEYLSEVTFSDLHVFHQIQKHIKEEDIVFAGNSSVVRYFQLFKNAQRAIYSNRGTSGIDGCLSTASGIAHNSTGSVYAIVGDLSFVYDSNALWNKRLPKNLKIILINNQGGGIFSLIPGPKNSSNFSEFFKANHPVSFDKLAAAFGVRYFFARNDQELLDGLHQVQSSDEASVLEINTDPAINEKSYAEFYNFLKKSYEHN